MTDKELMDGLQKLFDTKTVAISSRRSGLALYVSESSFSYDKNDNKNVRTYWGGKPPDEYGNDLRASIEKAILNETKQSFD